MAYPFNRLLGCGNLFLFHESLISLHLFYFSIAQITCEHSANTIFIHIHPLSLFGKAVFFLSEKTRGHLHEIMYINLQGDFVSFWSYRWKWYCLAARRHFSTS